MISTVAVKTRAPRASPTATKRCGLYVRVSTEMQTDGNSLGTQEVHLRRYVSQRDWLITKVFTDALSAKNTKRPALQQMLRWAREGNIDVVVVDKVDRISRNLIDLLKLIEDLRSWGVDFVTASQEIDTSTPAGTLMLNMLGSCAQFEREMIGERVRENMLERAKKGLWSGGVVPYGYKVNSDTKVLEVIPEESQMVKDVYAEFLRTKSLNKTCHIINSAGKLNRSGNAWSHVSLQRILSSPTYIGTLCYGKHRMRGDRLFRNDRESWITVPKAHEAIISKTDFEKAQAVLAVNSKSKPWAQASRYLLSGLGRCGICGSRIIGTSGYYRCNGRIQKGKSFCKGLSYRQDELDQGIISQIVGFDTKTLQKQIRRYQGQNAKDQKPLIKQQAKLEQAYEQFTEKEMKLLDLYEDGIINQELFKHRQDQLSGKKLGIAAELAEIEARLPSDELAQLDAEDLAKKFAKLQKTFANLDKDKQRRLVATMVREFTAYPEGRVELDLNLLAGLCKSDMPLGQYKDIDLRQEGKLETLGEKLKHYRSQQKLTQKQLAKLLGVDIHTLCQWECNRRRPSLRLGEMLLDKTGIGQDQL